MSLYVSFNKIINKNNVAYNKEYCVFYSTFTNKIQWTHPRTGRKKVIPKDLPFGWMKSSDDEGKTVYVHKENGSKTYVDPRLAFAKEQKAHVHDFRQRFDACSTAYQVATYLFNDIIIVHKIYW